MGEVIYIQEYLRRKNPQLTFDKEFSEILSHYEQIFNNRKRLLLGGIQSGLRPLEKLLGISFTIVDSQEFTHISRLFHGDTIKGKRPISDKTAILYYVFGFIATRFAPPVSIALIANQYLFN